MKRFLVACGLLVSALCTGQAVCAHREETIVTTVPYKEHRVRISGVLWVPHGGPARHPLAVFSHGSQSATGVGTYPVEPAQFAAFLERGYAVFIPMRKGFNRKGTPLPQVNAAQTEPLACSGAEQGLQSAVSDSKALFAALRSARRADVDFKNVTLLGHSRGGLLSVALAAEGLPGVRKVVNFSGGWQTDCPAFNTAKFAAFAERIRVPILSFYGAHDSAWDGRHVKANLAALEKEGKGVGYILSGAGHNLFETHAEVWAPVVFAR